MENSQVITVKNDGSLMVISCTTDDFLLEECEETLKGVRQLLEAEGDVDVEVEEYKNSCRLESNQPLTQLEVQKLQSLAKDETESNDELSLDMNDLDKLFEKELKNLEAVKKANESLKQMISASIPGKKEVVTLPVPKDVLCSAADEGFNSKVAEGGASTTPQNANLLRKLALRKKRKLAQQTGGINIQKFIQDYYKSLDSVSRYMIAASVIGFCVAFITLSSYGTQMHHNDMEIFKMKEKQFLSQQALYERSQQNHESFRENLIHQRYEETRECRSTLQSFLTGREDLFNNISKLEKDLHLANQNLKKAMEIHQEEIQQFQLTIEELQKENDELKLEKQNSLGSSLTQFILGLLSILRNRYLQIAAGGFSTIASMFFFMHMSSRK